VVCFRIGAPWPPTRTPLGLKGPHPLSNTLYDPLPLSAPVHVCSFSSKCRPRPCKLLHADLTAWVPHARMLKRRHLEVQYTTGYVPPAAHLAAHVAHDCSQKADYTLATWALPFAVTLVAFDITPTEDALLTAAGTCARPPPLQKKAISAHRTRSLALTLCCAVPPATQWAAAAAAALLLPSCHAPRASSTPCSRRHQAV
jgi:hypothetical protein